MQIALVMFRANGERRAFPLPRENTIIGRREDCDLRIPLGEVSRKHCRVIVEDDELRVEDMGSSNGTFVNGQRVREQFLKPGDTLQVGPVAFVLQVDGVPSDDEMSPVLAPSAGSAAEGEALTRGSVDEDDLLELPEAQSATEEDLEPRGHGSGSADLVDLDADLTEDDPTEHLHEPTRPRQSLEG